MSRDRDVDVGAGTGRTWAKSAGLDVGELVEAAKAAAVAAGKDAEELVEVDVNGGMSSNT